MSQFFPDLTKYNQFREPFLGGGSVALWVTKQYPDVLIWVNDLYKPLYNFWTQLQQNGLWIEDKLMQLKSEYPNPDHARRLFQEAKEQVSDPEIDPLWRAVYFYVINKCSYSGLTESSSFSSQASESNWSIRGIHKLPGYSELIKHWKITNHSYEKLMNGSDSFLYLDPPYEISSHLYGKKGDMHKYFDHDKFAKKCDGCQQDMLVSYNSSQLVRDRFSDWKSSEYEHTYTMRSTATYTKAQKDRKELVLLNYE